MQKRAMGLENEMSLFVVGGIKADKKFSIIDTEPLTEHFMISLYDIMESQKFKPDHKICGGTYNFLFNGGRIYKDSGTLESATPECPNPDEVVDYELANESILLDVMQEANDGCYFEISKKCGDFKDKEGGFGCHENYHLELPLGWKINKGYYNLNDFLNDFLKKLYPYLAPYLISRSPFIGAGHLNHNGRLIASHRLSATGSIFTSTTVTTGNKKTMLMIREERADEADALKGKFRLQICCSDANMSSFCTKFKFGPTSIILRMIEEGFWNKPPVVLSNTLQAINETADGDAELKIMMSNGQKISLLEINQIYFSAAGKFFETRAQSDDENKIMDMWGMAIRAQEKCPEVLDKAVDWRILRCFFSELLENKYEWSWQILQTNLQSDNPDLKKKARRILATLQLFNFQYFFLRKNELRQALKNAELIDGRLKFLENYSDSPMKFNPPNTRAKWRFKAINHALQHKSLYHLSIDWGTIIVEPPGIPNVSKIFFLKNPDPLNSGFSPTEFLRKKTAD